MNEEARNQLRRVFEDGSIQREMNTNGVPYAVATELMTFGYIEPATEVTEGLAKLRIKVWRITPAGIEALAIAESH